MKKQILLFIGLLFSGAMIAQTLTLRHEVQFNYLTNFLGDVGTSDCWGWTSPDGDDYAIVGNVDNVAFVRASDGLICDSVIAAAQNDGYYHRDMVTHGHYCYAVSEMNGVNQGLMIIDLSPLPDSVRLVGTWTNNGQFASSHNIDIDPVTNHLYVEGDANSGIDIISISSPEAPTKVGFIYAPGVHDVFARNDTCWVAEGSTPAYSIWDCTDKGNPVQLGRITDPTFGYCHNVWPSDDGRYFLTTEETSNKTVKIWDAQDMNNIVKRGEYIAGNQLAHNVHVKGDYVFISHYTSGTTIIDWSDKDMPVEVAAYDTYPQNDVSNYFGCWGTFPYTANGYVYASNFEGKLFILDWDPVGVVGIEDLGLKDHQLPYPTIFSEVTNIPFQLEGNSEVSIRVLNMDGKVVSELFSGEMGSGNYVQPWRPETGLAAGVYFIQLNIAGELITHKVVKQ